jgi:hypothetical protein
MGRFLALLMVAGVAVVVAAGVPDIKRYLKMRAM